jgi:uncharacterized hydrophobic protein (TIGR00271 family)
MTLFKVIRRILEFLNLESELEDYDLIHEEIKKGVVFKGTNLWILVFAIVVASVGLNVNSTAVIIGAMLISPLMGPINGMGYSIATYDFEFFRQSFKNFSFAVIISLVASTTYFALSPISTAQSELLARTSPTIYDVIIALFGGLAGIVAISSKNKGNVIPGVAIATALMPPLCTAGYGLATGKIDFFFGALYLFTINTVFIALASIAISQILKFPIRTVIDAQQKLKINRWISVVISIVVLPSIYFGYRLVQKEKFSTQAALFINNVSSIEGNYLLKNVVNPSTESINLVYGGLALSKEQKDYIMKESLKYDLKDAQIKIDQGINIGYNFEGNLEDEKLKGDFNRLSATLKSKEALLDSINKKAQTGGTLLNEIKLIFPQIEACAYNKSFYYSKNNNNAKAVDLLMVKTGSQSLSLSEKQKINEWAKMRLKSENLHVFFE